MARVLAFPAKDDPERLVGKTDRPQKRRRRAFRLDVPLRVVTTTLPSGERLPLLVDAHTWVPRSLAMRWVLYDRRYGCAESTLRRDVNALRFVYAWGDRTFAEGLDARLTNGPLEHGDLIALRGFLTDPDVEARLGRDGGPGARTTGAAGSRGLAAKLFLAWALNPASRNDAGASPVNALVLAQQIEGVLQPLAKHAGEGRRRVLPTDAAMDVVEEIMQPRMDARGRFLNPLQWHPKNPFRGDTRIRNWLMWTLARDSGLRLGEMLSLPARATVRTSDGRSWVQVRTDADRDDDSRARSPQAKTLSRLVPMGAHAVFALSAYLTAPGAGRRVMGNAYLFSARTGRPLSYNPANRVMRGLAAASGIEIGWHDLRHVWATEYARSVYRAAREGKHPTDSESTAMMALLTEKLRALGGWSATSTQPMYYARVAIKEEANRLLRGIQDARVERMAALRGSALEPAWLSEPDEELPW